MIYFLKKNKIIIVSTLLMLISIFIMSTQGGSLKEVSIVDKMIFYLTSPLQRTVFFGLKELDKLWKGYIYLINLREENANLKKKIKEFENENTEMREALVQAERLKELIGFREKFTYKTIPSRVIAMDPSNWFNTVIIDVGTKEGVYKGMTVINKDGLIGSIIVDSPRVSKVLLTIDRNSSIDVMVQRTRAKGILSGKGDSILELKYIKRSEDVKIGDYIVTSGLSGIYPKGILVGEVISIEKGSYGIFQKIGVLPSVNFKNIEDVLVIKDNKKELIREVPDPD